MLDRGRWLRYVVAACGAFAVMLATAAMRPVSAQGGGVVRVTSDDAGPRCVQARGGDRVRRRERGCRVRRRTRRLVRASGSTTYQNPVFGSFPDPMAHFTGVEYYAYSTGSRFPVIRSTDLVNWESVGTAFAHVAGMVERQPVGPQRARRLAAVRRHAAGLVLHGVLLPVLRRPQQPAVDAR